MYISYHISCVFSYVASNSVNEIILIIMSKGNIIFILYYLIRVLLTYFLPFLPFITIDKTRAKSNTTEALTCNQYETPKFPDTEDEDTRGYTNKTISIEIKPNPIDSLDDFLAPRKHKRMAARTATAPHIDKICVIIISLGGSGLFEEEYTEHLFPLQYSHKP